MAARVVLENIVKRYESVGVIHGVNLVVEPGEFVVLVGPSGCGKSTLLRMIAGLEPITGGQLYIDGELVNDVAAARRGLAMVFQSYALYPHMSAYKNMAFGLETARVPRDEIERRVREAARVLRIEELLSRKPRHLSGGQRQRVAIGRAIVRNPRIFLFDEPLSNLDADLRVQMRVELTKLHRTLGATMIYVTHDQVEAMTMASKIVVLNAGRIEQVGSPLEIYNHPANRFVAGFVGSPRMNFLDVAADKAGSGGVAVKLPGGRALGLPVPATAGGAGASLTLGIRPEHLVLGEGDGALECQVSLSEQLGDKTLVYATLPDGQPLVAQVPGQVAVEVGSTLSLGFREERCHLFGPDGRALR